MGIQKIAGGGTIATGTGVTVVRLLSVRLALGAEARGMQLTRGPKIRKGWALNMGLKANASYDDVIAAVEKRLAELRPAVAAENAVNQ